MRRLDEEARLLHYSTQKREPAVTADPSGEREHRMIVDLERAECTVHSAREFEAVPHPELAMTNMLRERIIVGPKGVAQSAKLGDDFSPIRIGFLSDIPRGNALGRSLDPIIFALEDAINEGRLTRAVEIIALHTVGLPAGQPRNVIAAYRYLVDLGCIFVHSVGVTDNALILRDEVNAAKVPMMTMAGTTKFFGPYCFSLANGGHGEEASMLAAYVADQGHKRIVFAGERSPGDIEYQAFFRDQARLYGLEVLKEHFFDSRPSDDEMDAALTHFRDDLRPDALVYCGFGWNSGQFNASLERIGWNPPKIMNSAIMWALTGPEMARALDGWIGIEQTIEEHDLTEPNRNLPTVLNRYEARFGYRPGKTMTALLYDQGRSVAEAIINAPILTGEGIVQGLERIKMMPSLIGGPRTYIDFGPENHRGYKGDFLLMKQLRDGEFHFVSYHWPVWPINRMPEQ
jgi:ABC-type branched-subunit amino acid transport system substrate-binding protein